MLLNGLADTMIWDWLQIGSKVFHVATYMNTIHSIIFQLIATEDGPAAAKKISKCNPDRLVTYSFESISKPAWPINTLLRTTHLLSYLSASIVARQV